MGMHRRARKMDAVSSAIMAARDECFELDPGSTHIPVLAGMTTSCGHLPMQKVEKIAPSKSSLVNSPVISPR
jgi:hypothetical protein